MELETPANTLYADLKEAQRVFKALCDLLQYSNVRNWNNLGSIKFDDELELDFESIHIFKEKNNWRAAITIDEDISIYVFLNTGDFICNTNRQTIKGTIQDNGSIKLNVIPDM